MKELVELRSEIRNELSEIGKWPMSDSSSHTGFWQILNSAEREQIVDYIVKKVLDSHSKA